VDHPRSWIEHVNEPITEKELQRLRASVDRGQPFGSEAWTRRTVGRLHLEHTVRREGRPAKEKEHVENDKN
jgi:hypothetical protein